jgi:hypothetical protein
MREVLKSLVPVICPPEAVHLADQIVDHLLLTFGATPPIVQKALAAGLTAYDLGAVARYGKRARSLTGDKAERYFRLWEGNQLGKVLNQLMSLSCYEQPEVLEAIGYRPEGWIKEVTKKRLTVFADDVRAQERQILAPDPLRPSKNREVA